MQLPLKGLEEFVRRAGRPEAEIEAASKRGDYRLSERQAKAILEMRLARLTGLEQEKLAAEYGELCDEIARLRAILGDETAPDGRHRRGARGGQGEARRRRAAPRSSTTRPRSRSRT